MKDLTTDSTVTYLSPFRTMGFHEGNHAAIFQDYKVFSAFQPIFSFSHRRKVGLEALVRGIDESSKAVPPWKLFNKQSDYDLFELEKILTQVHLDNFKCLDLDNTWLFLNIHPSSLTDFDSYYSYFRELLTESEFPAHRIVIEVLETEFHDDTALEYAFRKFKELGCMIAIDDFGAGHSNFERVWRMDPDIVKFDRSMIQRAAKDPSIEVMLKGTVDILHSRKCIVLAEGIETYEEAIVAMDANIDLGQGFLLSRPYHVSDPVPRNEITWAELYASYETFSYLNKISYEDKTQDYITEFNGLLERIEHNVDLSHMAEGLINLPRTMRIYMLSRDGSQLSSNIETEAGNGIIEERMEPLYQAAGANWKLRPYYRNAINNPAQIQITPPYLSITDAELCITLSQTVEVNGELMILCCDVKWDY